MITYSVLLPLHIHVGNPSKGLCCSLPNTYQICFFRRSHTCTHYFIVELSLFKHAKEWNLSYLPLSPLHLSTWKIWYIKPTPAATCSNTVSRRKLKNKWAGNDQRGYLCLRKTLYMNDVLPHSVSLSNVAFIVESSTEIYSALPNAAIKFTGTFCVQSER